MKSNAAALAAFFAVSCAAACLAADSSAADACHEAEWRGFLDPPPKYADFQHKVRKTASYARDGLLIELYEQANGPGKRQRVMLALPQNASGRLPAVVVPFYFPEAMLGFNPVDGSQCVTGLVANATNLAYYAAITYMSDLARRGYATISADAYYLTYALEGMPKSDWGKWGHAGAALARDWPGWTGVGKLAFDTRLLVDMLVADDRVDAGRIGIIGHSLGGKMAFYAGCLDTRIKVIVASDFGIGWDQTNWQDSWYWGARLKEIRGIGATHADLLSMSHGKPFCLIAGKYDNEDSEKIMRAARGYDGCADRLVIINHATGHRPPAWATEAGYKFLDRYLKGGRD